jgi:hypothetical protein
VLLLPGGRTARTGGAPGPGRADRRARGRRRLRFPGRLPAPRLQRSRRGGAASAGRAAGPAAGPGGRRAGGGRPLHPRRRRPRRRGAGPPASAHHGARSGGPRWRVAAMAGAARAHHARARGSRGAARDAAHGPAQAADGREAEWSTGTKGFSTKTSPHASSSASSIPASSITGRSPAVGQARAHRSAQQVERPPETPRRVAPAAAGTTVDRVDLRPRQPQRLPRGAQPPP